MVHRDLDFRKFTDVYAELNRLVEYGYTKHGNWTLGQICAHLSIFVEGSIEGFKGPPVPWYRRMLAPLFVRWMLKRRRMPAGAKTLKQCLGVLAPAGMRRRLSIQRDRKSTRLNSSH